jgi:hypothetical protein
LTVEKKKSAGLLPTPPENSATIDPIADFNNRLIQLYEIVNIEKLQTVIAQQRSNTADVSRPGLEQQAPSRGYPTADEFR